ncbi:Bcr/CflA family drug resistance efflux transporter [Lysobacter helvus]|uniref:Bcr/CflA family efflux transporter n=2 Tax=Lysobacteraceae TaxID=32033 RepID=A0ABM7Q290_9GAMM|nr:MULTISPECIES: multidrug effflux MFS transporter [Lysobacter]BCT91314.1 Bcr/CflA family drug resistance efflux transporter [Lysobacter caseinilyticus]BCT94467.1 Bcr/CflA family drug resistance efflux transporter [Lysobacter helvus]
MDATSRTDAKPGLSTKRLAVLLGGLAMFGPFSIDTIFPAFPQMGAQLGADKLAMQQTISVYLIAYALTSLVHGPLSDAIGRRRVILGGLAIFAAASAGCALSTDLTTLLLFRALQGLSAGVGLIVGRAVIRDVLHGHDAQRLMSQVSMIFGIAPAIAPVIGGWMLGWSAWPTIFWFLVAFSALLWIATLLALPETHPPQARLKLRGKALLRDYVAIFLNPRFQRLAAAGTFNFGALFLYIASAPAFVLDLLKLDQRSFAWFFVPMIGGMMLGAFTSGRIAGKVAATQQVRLGFACCGAAAVANLAYNVFVPVPTVPWAVLPMMLNSFGIALVFPILTLAILDMYPRQRGSASSLQAFTGLVSNAFIAGVLSPLLSQSPLRLAIGAACFTTLGWAFWKWESRSNVPMAACAPSEAAALEPTERL